MIQEGQRPSFYPEGVFPEETIKFANGIELIPDPVEVNIFKTPFDKIKRLFPAGT